MSNERKPWSVVTVVGKVTVNGYDDMVQANAAAGEKNQQAEALGIVARYEAIETALLETVEA